jgi:hypothetical protein
LEYRFLTRAIRIRAANVRERCRPTEQLLAVKALAHGVSRRNGPCTEEPPEGAEDGAVESSAPERGFVNLAVPPRLAPWAMFFRSYELWFAAFPDLHFCVAHPSRFTLQAFSLDKSLS